MEEQFVSSFEKHQIINGKEQHVKGRNNNGHVIMQGMVDGKPFYYDNKLVRQSPSHKLFRKTPFPTKKQKPKKRKYTRRGEKGKKETKRKKRTIKK